MKLQSIMRKTKHTHAQTNNEKSVQIFDRARRLFTEETHKTKTEKSISAEAENCVNNKELLTAIMELY